MFRESNCDVVFLSIIVIAAAMVPSAMADPLANGDFESGLSPWIIEGTVTIENAGASGNAAVLHETDSRGLSRIYQDFDIDAGAEWLSFRYRLYSNVTGDSAVPPDSFGAILTDQGSPRMPLIAVSQPGFSKAMLYEDARGEFLRDSAYVYRAPTPDPDGFYTVVMDISSLSDQDDTPARIEFSFANGDNNRNSVAIVDGIILTCPGGFCCDPLTGDIAILDDGLVCTIDTCDANGLPQHDLIPCCGECVQAEADVVIVIDVTAGVSQEQLTQQKDAVKALLNRFASASPRPSIAIGTFNEQASADNARVLPGGGLTQDYGVDGNPGTGLYAAINSITYPTSGETDLASAITLARSVLELIENANRKYIVLISDGLPNIPDTCAVPCDDPCYCACAIAEAQSAADIVHDTLSDMRIVTIYFEDSALCPTLPDCCLNGADLMLSIASGAEYALVSNDLNESLSCAFEVLGNIIACDDLDVLTNDECISGACTYTPAP